MAPSTSSSSLWGARPSLGENAKEPPVGQIPENAGHPASSRDHRRHLGGWHEEGPFRGGREERLPEELLQVGLGEPGTACHGVRPGKKGVEPACLFGRDWQLRKIWGEGDRRWCCRWGSTRAGPQRRRKLGEAPGGEPKGRRKKDLSDESDRATLSACAPNRALSAAPKSRTSRHHEND